MGSLAGFPLLLLGRLLLMLGKKGVEVDRLQHQLRKTPLGDQVGDYLSGIWKKHIRAVGTQQVG
jgi:hypothetical protein